MCRFLIDRKDSIGWGTVKKFIISRSFKIWPSYYFFFFVGNATALALYGSNHAGAAVSWSNWPKFLFFYSNYRGTENYIFDHLWSLCVEEHFYLLLPFGLWVWSARLKKIPLFYMIGFSILAGNLMRICSLLIHFEPYAATHNRIDSLLWGALLYLLQKEKALEKIDRSILFISGFILLITTIALENFLPLLYKQLFFHGLTPISFFFLLSGSMGFEMKQLHWLRIIYLLSGFFLAFIATHLIEETGLKYRERWFAKNPP